MGCVWVAVGKVMAVAHPGCVADLVCVLAADWSVFSVPLPVWRSLVPIDPSLIKNTLV